MTVRSFNKQPPEPRSCERQALAEAIDEKRAADAALEAQRSAVQRAERLVSDAENKFTAAVAAVAAAREEQARRVAEAVSAGSRPRPASPLRAARAAETEAQDDLDAARAALEQLQAEFGDLEAETASAGVAVEAAINAVLAGAAPRLVSAIEAHRTQLLELLSISYFIMRRGSERHGSSAHFTVVPALAKPLATAAAEIDTAIQVGTGAWNSNVALAHPVVSLWEEAVAALRVEADALLPIRG